MKRNKRTRDYDDDDYEEPPRIRFVAVSRQRISHVRQCCAVVTQGVPQGDAWRLM